MNVILNGKVKAFDFLHMINALPLEHALQLIVTTQGTEPMPDTIMSSAMFSSAMKQIVDAKWARINEAITAEREATMTEQQILKRARTAIQATGSPFDSKTDKEAELSQALTLAIVALNDYIHLHAIYSESNRRAVAMKYGKNQSP